MVVSFDPGTNGGIVFHDSSGKFLESHKMPLDGKQVSFNKLSVLLCNTKKRSQNIIAIHEIVTEHFQGGRKSSFTFGQNYQIVLDALDANDIPRVGVNPKKWQDVVFEGIEKVYEINPKTKRKKHLTKQTALLAKEKYYPGLNLKRTERCKEDDDGLVDALLIGLYFFKTKK